MEIDRIQNMIDTAYDQMKKHPYTLFAVWVHQGGAGSGHYWAHIRNCKTNQVIRFNDVRVNEVDEETVMKEAVGGSVSNASAYFLIYVALDVVEKFGFDKCFPLDPDSLKHLIPSPLLVKKKKISFTKKITLFLFFKNRNKWKKIMKSLPKNWLSMIRLITLLTNWSNWSLNLQKKFKKLKNFLMKLVL